MYIKNYQWDILPIVVPTELNLSALHKRPGQWWPLISCAGSEFIPGEKLQRWQWIGRCGGNWGWTCWRNIPPGILQHKSTQAQWIIVNHWRSAGNSHNMFGSYPHIVWESPITPQRFLLSITTWEKTLSKNWNERWCNKSPGCLNVVWKLVKH